MGSFKRYISSKQFFTNYSRMWPYFKPYWFRSLIAMLICIPIGSLDAVIALALRPYMDLVMIDQSLESPWYIPMTIIFFALIQGILTYLSFYLNTWVGTKVANGLKRDLFSKLLSHDAAYYNNQNSGDLIYRYNNIADSACSGLLDNLRIFIQRFFGSISLVFVLFYNSWQLAIVAIIVLGLSLAPVASIRKRINSVFAKSVQADSAVLTVYNETISGNKTISSYNLQDYQRRSFDRILGNIFGIRIKMVQRTSWLSPLMHIIISIGIAFSIGFGSHLILTQQITAGSFVSFITALILLYNPIKNIGNNFNQVQLSFLAIESVFGSLSEQPSIVNAESTIEMEHRCDSIVFDNVNFEYVANTPVLHNISFSASGGESIALVGNSGGGKSTIANLLPRFYDVTSGSIRINGIDIREYSVESLRDNISVVFQDNFLFSATIRENIMCGRADATPEEFEQALKLAYLDEFVSTLECGVDTYIGERGVLLSGGQKQRVAIARAFLKDAPIVVMDEATSALDNQSEAIVQKAIDNLMKSKTVFVIAHRLSTIVNADKIVVLNHGVISEMGTHSELLAIEGGAYSTLYNAQFRES
ncbi:MAG: ABC transporter transmembrane domain-containing protein [Rikenellaceae bacterium]